MSGLRTTTVLVLFGGRSAEHEISILSAGFIVRSLDRARFTPLLVGIAPNGRWHLLQEHQLPTSNSANDVKIDTTGPHVWIEPMPSARPDGRAVLRVANGEDQPFDVLFPIMHGPLGEDGCTQGLCELIGVPYVGSGVAASAVSMDKVLQKQLFAEAELPQVPYRQVSSYAYGQQRTLMLERCEELPYPLFVKPANMGSSLGVARASRREQLANALEAAFELDTKVIVERGLSVPREIELSVLGNDEAEVSVAGEIVVDHPDGFYSYDAKYLAADGARLLVPAVLTPAQLSALQLLALRAFRVLNCAGMARVDLFLDNDGEPYLNEVNTIPGFTAISMYPQLWSASGVDASALVGRLIALAFERSHTRAALRTHR